MKRIAAVMLVAAVGVAHAGVQDDLRDGDAAFDDQQWAKAAGAYDRAIAAAPGQVSAEAYGKRAAIYIITGDYKGGLVFIERAKQRLPNAPELEEQEALMLWETEKRDDAIKLAEKVVVALPKAFSNHKIIGEYYASRDAGKTAAAFEAYLATRPSDLEKGDVLPRLRLGVADLELARAAIGKRDEGAARELYGKAAQQFELVERRHGKKANAQVNADTGLCAAYTGLEKWDQAIPRCEKIASDGKHVDRNGSVYFNLATAYLARKQPKKARGAAQEFTKLRKTEARGFMLVGDTYFAEGDWPHALASYLEAEKVIQPAQSRAKIELSIKLGKTYRRMPGDDGKNLALAIDKLGAAQAADPASVEIALELGDAYLAGKQEAKAAQLADKVLADKGDKTAEERAQLLEIAGDGHFAQRHLADARQRFEAARQIRPNDVGLRRDLVATINEQALDAKESKDAVVFLDQAIVVDPDSAVTLSNLAIFAIERGECDQAVKHLVHLERVRGSDPVLRPRLLGRAYMCEARPEPQKASEAYAVADKEARAAGAQALLAEIDTEWAPLLWDSDLAGAIEKLEGAVKIAGNSADVGPAAKRNLALALYRRGWKSMAAGRAAEAAGDFERATKEPALLKGTEPSAFEFSHALALMDAGRVAEAAKMFKGLEKKGAQASYLKAPFAKLGTQLFAAYASYRSGTPAGHAQAAAELARLQNEVQSGPFADKLRELVAGAYEAVAYDEWRVGNQRAAGAALANAGKNAQGDMARRIDLDRIVLSLDKSKLGALEGMGGNPAESLVSLGIVYDLLGRPKDAYEVWSRAKSRGVQAKDLQKWIDAKKRIFGFQ